MNYLLKGWYLCPGTGWKVVTEINFQENGEDGVWEIVNKQYPHIKDKRLFQEVEPTK